MSKIIKIIKDDDVQKLAKYLKELKISIDELNSNFISSPSDNDSSDNEEWNILHLAVCYNSTKVIKYLIEVRRMDPMKFTGLGKSPLHLAVEVSNNEAVIYLINVPRINHFLKQEEKLNLLELAIENKNNKLIKYSIEKGIININAKNSEGLNCLQLAILSQNIELVKYLIEEMNMSIDIKTFDGLNCLQLAILSQYIDLVKYFIEEMNMSIDIKTQEGLNCLQLSIESGEVETVQYLIEEKGMDVNVITQEGLNCLQLSIESGDVETVQYLIEERGMDVNVKTQDGLTCLHLGIKGGNAQTVQYLIEKKGMNINVVTPDGLTCLHLAIKRGDVDIVKYLVQHGADIDALTEDGKNIFYIAYCDQWDNEELITYIDNLKRGDNDWKQKGNWELCNRLAIMQGFPALLEALESLPKLINLKNEHGKTFLDLIMIVNEEESEFSPDKGERYDLAKYILEKKPELLNESNMTSSDFLIHALSISKTEGPKLFELLCQYGCEIDKEKLSESLELFENAKFKENCKNAIKSAELADSVIERKEIMENLHDNKYLIIALNRAQFKLEQMELSEEEKKVYSKYFEKVEANLGGIIYYNLLDTLSKIKVNSNDNDNDIVMEDYLSSKDDSNDSDDILMGEIDEGI